MTQATAEKRIGELMKEIRAIALEYNPNERYISMCINTVDGLDALTSFNVNNSYWDSDDSYFPINRTWHEER